MSTQVEDDLGGTATQIGQGIKEIEYYNDGLNVRRLGRLRPGDEHYVEGIPTIVRTDLKKVENGLARQLQLFFCQGKPNYAHYDAILKKKEEARRKH